MLNAAVCDDSAEVRINLEKCLKGHQAIDQVDVFESGEQLLAVRKHYDILFLDIDMKGINGIETGRRIRKWDKQAYIVYVTHLLDYQKYAMGVHAFGYLEKPVKYEAINSIINEVLEYRKDSENSLILEFKTEDGIKRLDVRNIYYFEYCERSVIMYTQNGNFRLRQKISELVACMKQYSFSQPHKSFCVNLFHVQSIKGYDIRLTGNAVVPLSQKKSAAFREELNVYLGHLIG